MGFINAATVRPGQEAEMLVRENRICVPCIDERGLCEQYGMEWYWRRGKGDRGTEGTEGDVDLRNTCVPATEVTYSHPISSWGDAN